MIHSVNALGRVIAFLKQRGAARVDDPIAPHGDGAVRLIADTLPFHGEQVGVNKEGINWFCHTILSTQRWTLLRWSPA